MLSKPVATLLGACLFAGSVIYLVHHSQIVDRKQMHIGVERDLEKQNRRRENQKLLEDQLALKRTLESKERPSNV
ncbi:hypothetical protein EMCRGX_G032071 [Ephydatia muelleri]|eukprot:Em0019g758a